QAIKEINRVLEDQTADRETRLDARRLLADVTSFRGGHDDHLKALQMYAALRQELPRDTALEIREAEVTLWAKQYEKALQLFQGLYDRFPTDPRIWYGLASSVADVAPPMCTRRSRRQFLLPRRASCGASPTAPLTRSRTSPTCNCWRGWPGRCTISTKR